jgi:hypothetical protein
MGWLQYILAQDSIPQTFTTSYGDDEQTVPRAYAESVCTMFAQLGARGSSIMFSSGDFGVGAADCKTNDGTNRTVFQPSFPASCECLVPYDTGSLLIIIKVPSSRLSEVPLGSILRAGYFSLVEDSPTISPLLCIKHARSTSS